MIYILIFVLASIIIFIPEIFPKCGNCGRIRPRFNFRLHKSISLRLSRKGNISVCRKCYDNENITSFDKLKKVNEIKKRSEWKAKYYIRGQRLN